MVEEARDRARDEDTADGEAIASEASGPKWKRLLRHRWVVFVVAATFLIQGVGFTYFRYVRAPSAPAPSPEIPLGRYSFHSEDVSVGSIEGAAFSLRVALLGSVGAEARRQLMDYRYRVQQNVEELLRQAHGADFEDPTLRELKRQLQARINATLGVRAVADVIITDMQLTWKPGPSGATPPPATAGNAQPPFWQPSSDVASAPPKL